MPRPPSGSEIAPSAVASRPRPPLPLAPLRPTWRDLAACVDMAPTRPDEDDPFFADKPGALYVEALAVCARCPLAVRAACLTDALITDPAIPYGVRGGMLPADRRALARSIGGAA